MNQYIILKQIILKFKVFRHHEYTLDSYNKNGKKKQIKFKTNRELREEAYLMLEVTSMGVHSWKEVQYNELPEKVKTNYEKQQ